MNLASLKYIDFEQEAKHILTDIPEMYGKLKDAVSFSEEQTEQGVAEMLKYLYLVGITADHLTPSHLVDMVWHEFILFTKKYMTYCQDKFSRYIHHFPGGKKEDNHRDFIKTLKIYSLYIGIPPKDFWGEGGEEMGMDADCGTDF